MEKAKQRVIERKRRAARVKKSLFGTTQRPRLCVRRSLKHIYAQIVDDLTGKSLVTAGSSLKEVVQKSSSPKKLTKIEVAKIVGEMLGDKAKEKGIEKVVFDRKGYIYHGRVKALAEAARSKGLVF